MRENQEKQEYFILHANCLITKGYSRSLISDVQWQRIRFIPNLLVEVLSLSKTHTISEIKKHYNHELDDGIDVYISSLIKNEWGIVTSSTNFFPTLSLEWDYPSLISNAIIDIKDTVPHYFNKFIQELNNFRCEALQIRILSSIEHNSLYFMCEILNNIQILYVEIILPFEEYLTSKSFIEKITTFPIIRKIHIYGSPYSKNINVKSTEFHTLTILTYSTDNVDITSCGKISEAFLSPNLEIFTESQKHNTCLNRKISIDVNGEIKNCPSMVKSYGNIKDTTLKEAIEKVGFKDVWYIHKDQIEVCKDCEFRHICTDCRAYIQDPNNIYSKPAKCSYDPYTATWGEENPTDNPLYGK